MERFSDIRKLGLTNESTGVVVANMDIDPEFIGEILKRDFRLRDVEALWSEVDFRRGVSKWIQNTPDLFFIGCAFPWDFPGLQKPAVPRAVREGGYYRAGQRCVDLLDRFGLLAQTKVLYSCPLGEDSCSIKSDHPNVLKIQSNDLRDLQIIYKDFLAK
jgi:hypothetical protein